MGEFHGTVRFLPSERGEVSSFLLVWWFLNVTLVRVSLFECLCVCACDFSLPGEVLA